MAEKHPTKLVASTPRLDRALTRIVKWHGGENKTARETTPKGKQQSLTGNMPVENTQTADNEYNGYFKLVDMTEYNEDGTVKAYKVGVVDGETFDGVTSGPSIISVDGSTKSIPMIVRDIERNKTLFLSVIYEWKTTKVELKVTEGVLPGEDDSVRILYIGSATIQSGVLQTTQVFKEDDKVPEVSTEYSGPLKLYRFENSDGSWSFGISEGYVDAVGSVPDTPITWDGSVYMNFRVVDDKITYKYEKTGIWRGENTVSIYIGNIDPNGIIRQSRFGVSLAGDYVI